MIEHPNSELRLAFVIYWLPRGLIWQSICLQCWRPGFHPWVGKIPCRRKWQPTPVPLPGKSHGQRSLVGYSPWGCKELDTPEQIHSLLWYTVTTRLFVIREWGNLCSRDIRLIEFKETLRNKNKVIRTLLCLFNVTCINFNCMKISY